MPRRNLDRKKVPAPDERTAARYLLELPGDRLYREPLAFPRLSSASLFGNEKPLELEIGCGNGEFLCSLARRDHETNFVGVEVKRTAVHEAVARASSAELDNVIFLRANFRLLYPLLIPGSLGAVYLHFPDPNARARFRKHRIFSDRFLREMHTATTSDARISVMRDHEKSFAEMLEVAESDERWEKNHAQRYLVGFAAESRSRFQRIWEGHGLPTLRFELVKRGDGEQRVALRTKKVVACASGARGVNTDSGHELGGPEGSSEKVRHRWIGEPRETGRDTDPPSLCPSPRRAG